MCLKEFAPIHLKMLLWPRVINLDDSLLETNVHCPFPSIEERAVKAAGGSKSGSVTDLIVHFCLTGSQTSHLHPLDQRVYSFKN